MSMWPVFVINMDANPQRMAAVAAELTNLDIPFERFPAINGRAISEDELAVVYDVEANARRARYPLIPAEIGCYLSHIAIWKQIAAAEAAGGIVLEDDFSASDDLRAILEALSKDGGGWDIAKLFSLHRRQGVVARRPLIDGSELVIPYKVPTTTLGYAIRKEAAGRLATIALPVSRPIDEDHKHFWEIDLRVASVMPPPLKFSETASEDGTIQSTRRRSNRLRGAAALAQSWRNLQYRVRYSFNLHWQRLLHGAGKGQV